MQQRVNEINPKSPLPMHGLNITKIPHMETTSHGSANTMHYIIQ